MTTQSRTRFLVFLSSLLVAAAFAAGCAGSSDRSDAAGGSGAIQIKTLLDNPSKYNDQTVRIEGVVESSVGAFGQGAYDVDDGTGQLTVITGSGDSPPTGTRVAVDGEFESVFTIGSETGAVLKESKRTVRE